jgi:hypothetical protein
MFETDDGDLLAAGELGCLQPAMASNNLFVLIDQNGRVEAKRFYAPGDSSNLCPIMCAWVAWVGLQIGDRKKSEFPALERWFATFSALLLEPLFRPDLRNA